MDKQVIKEIENHKSDISRLLYEYLKDYTYDKKGLESRIKKEVKDTIVYSVNQNDYTLVRKDPYLTSIKRQIEEIKDLSGISINFPIGIYSSKTKEKEIAKSEYINDLYKKYKRFFYQTISPAKLEKVYENIGQEKFNLLINKIEELKDNVKFFAIKRIKAKKAFQAKEKEFEDMDEKLKEKYNITDLDDLYEFYNRLQTLFIDSNKLLSHEMKFISDNKRYILNKLKVTKLSRLELEEINKELTELINSETLNFYYKSPYITDLLNFTKWTKLKIYELVEIHEFFLEYTRNAIAFCTVIRNKKIIFFRDEIIKEHPNSQLSVIIHEFIHSLEDKTNPQYLMFISKYRALNEALTEYIAREILKRNKEYKILSKYDESQELKLGYVSYEYYINALKDTWLWKELISCKIENRYKDIEKIIDCKTIEKINSMFAYSGASLSDILQQINSADKITRNTR